MEKMGVPALFKGFGILDLIANEPGLGFAAIQQRLGLPKSSCHLLIASLCRLGVLQMQADRSYVLGLRLFELGAQAANQRQIDQDLKNVFGGDRQIVFAREITKLFESIHRCLLAEATDWLNADANNQRGEFVLLVSGAAEKQEGLDAEAERILTLLLKDLPLKQAVQLAVQISGTGRNELYQRALQIKGQE